MEKQDILCSANDPEVLRWDWVRKATASETWKALKMLQAQKQLFSDLMNSEKAKYFNGEIVICARNQSAMFKTVDEFLHRKAA